MHKNKIAINRKPTWIIQLVPYILIVLSAITVYSNSFDCAFQFDDSINITQSEFIRDLDNFKDVSFWTNVNLRPLAMYSFALNYHQDKLNLSGFHVFNLIVHILTTFIVFLFIKKILTLYLLKSKSQTDIALMSFFVAMIFSIHPIQTQSVTYIVQRMTSMSGLFYILSVYLYTVARQRHTHNRFSIEVLFVYLFSFFSFILSMMSKQIAVTIPLALILIELFFIRDKQGKVFKKYIYIFSAILIVAFLVVALTGNLPRETNKISRFEYQITQFRVMVKYIQLLLLPINQNLDHDIKPSTTIWSIPEFTSFLFICFLILLIIIFYKKSKIVSFGIAWFFITQALESTIFPISDMMYEHRLYLASMGYSLILVYVTSHIIKNRKYKIMLFILIITAYGYATIKRNLVWKTKYTLWTDTVKKSPQKARPNYNMGNQLYDSGNYELAVKYYMKALEVEPDNVQVYTSLGSAWNYLGDQDKAIAMYKKAIMLEPNYSPALQNLGILYYSNNELDEAKLYYERYTNLNSGNADIYNLLGIIYGRQKEYHKAENYFYEALKIAPSFTNPMQNLSLMYLQQNRLDQAQEMYEKILKVEPQNARTWNDLGIIWSYKNEYTKAIACYQKALSIQPDFKDAEQNIKIAEQNRKSKK